jgi:hypothetical protein
MRLNLATIRKLGKYASLTTHDITPDIAKELLDILGLRVDEAILNELITQLKNDDEDSLIDWIADPDRQDSLLQKVKPVEKKLTIECPKCLFVALYSLNEVASVEPHVVCRGCGGVIPLSED